MINTSTEQNITQEKIAKAHDTHEADIPQIIANNIKTTHQILSSSPSEMAEQAKSYVLGKFNNTVSSEVQQWLSQFAP
jgi:adhesin/invasin